MRNFDNRHKDIRRGSPQPNGQRPRANFGRQNHSPGGMYRPQPPRRADEGETRFYAGTAVDPSPRIRLESGSSEMTMRVMDLITPIGFGQRGLIVAPPGSGKTTFLKHICQAIGKAYPQIKLYCLLVNERPEEVTDFKRTAVSAEVRSSSSDEDYEHHIRVANDLMRDAYRQVADGKDVMIVIDSLTRLARVHNADRNSGRTLSGGVDARALEAPRRIFGAARKIEHGGSLTMLATILVQTGSRMDDVIFEEFKGTGNMEIVLSREISGRRIFPAVDISKSGTRKEELLLVDPGEIERIRKMRRALAEIGNVEATKTLVEQLEKTPNNQKFLSRFAV